MTTTRLPATLVLSAIAVLAGTGAMAQDAGGWYGGASAGRSMARIDDARITANLLAGGYATTSIADDDRSTGYKLYGGYRLNRNFALEGGYFSLGRFGYRATTVPAGTLSGEMKVQGLNLDLVGILPLGERFEVFGRVGAAYAQTRDRFISTGAVTVANANPRKNDTNLKVGLGLGYQFSESLGMRIEAERYRINDAVGNKGDVDLVSVGLVWRFGPKAQPLAPRAAVYVAPPEPAPAPAPVVIAAAPPPPPPPTPVVMAAPPMKVTFSADALFDFDKSAIKPEGRESLDRFLRDLSGTRYDAVSVTGHTDRIGGHAYNLKLSARRADAVGSYLATGGIPAAKISTRGVDGADPVTRPGDCPGRRVTPALISCLQPDRRVDVEVSGTK